MSTSRQRGQGRVELASPSRARSTRTASHTIFFCSGSALEVSTSLPVDRPPLPSLSHLLEHRVCRFSKPRLQILQRSPLSTRRTS